MHVFCPDCNAEYKVSERSSLTKAIKFVCYECGNSWVDKFEKVVDSRRVIESSTKSDNKEEIEKEVKKIETTELNTLALDEVQNSFGNQKSNDNKNEVEKDSDHIFQFETEENNEEIVKDGPSKTFPKLRDKDSNLKDDQTEQRDVKEIEIEKRLKESSELLKKAKQAPMDNTETTTFEKKPKKNVVLLTLSILLIVSFFVFNLAMLFLDDLVKKFPLALQVHNTLVYLTTAILDKLLILKEQIMNIISNLE